MVIGGPDRIRTDDLTLRKRSHYPSYATSPKSLGDLHLIWIAISQIDWENMYGVGSDS